MDWIKLSRSKIYDLKRFLLYLLFLIILTSAVLIIWNAFLVEEDLSKILFSNYRTAFIRNLFIFDRFFWIPEPVTIALFGLSILWFFLFLELFFKSIYRFLNSPPTWNLKRDFDFNCFNDLEIQGKIEGKDKKWNITNSASGILLKNNYWQNCEIKFSFNFKGFKFDQLPESDLVKVDGWFRLIPHHPRSNFFGLLFRAQDLNNYFMISIGIKQIIKERQSKANLASEPYINKLLITPHTKVDGKWEIFNNDKFDLGDIELDGDNEAICIVRENIMTLNVKNANVDYEWILPTKFRANWAEEDVKDKSEVSFGDFTAIPFRSSYGMIGFRAYGKEHVAISDLNITKLYQ